MGNEIIQEAKKKILNSPVAKYVSEDKINLAFEKIYVCNSREELYEKYYEINNRKYDGFLNKEKRLEIANKINKGAQKLIKKREFYKKHPFLAKIANKIGKNNDTHVPALKPANIINFNNEDLSSKLKEDIAPIEEVQITEKEDKIEEKQINEETIEV